MIYLKRLKTWDFEAGDPFTRKQLNPYIMSQSELNEQLERENCKLRLTHIAELQIKEQEIKKLWLVIHAHERTTALLEQLTNELKLELQRAEREDQLKAQRIIDLDSTIKLLQAQLFAGNVINN